jgi:hypothetical protein
METSMSDFKNEETKEALKEAIKEWLDDRVKNFGWFTIKTIIGLAVAGILYLAFVGTGHFK